MDVFTCQEVAPGSDQIPAWIARLRKEPCHSTLSIVTRRRSAPVVSFSQPCHPDQLKEEPDSCPFEKWGTNPKGRSYSCTWPLHLEPLEVEKKTLFEKGDREEERRELASGEKVAGLDPLGSDLS